jgi:hypothetical protein
MFCSNCGKAEQKENTYCRSCGEFLSDSKKKNKIAFGGNTPEEQINVNLFLNLLSAVVSLILGIALYWTIWDKGDISPIIYIVAAFLLAMSGWQFSTFAVGLKLKKTFRKRKSNAEKEESSEEKPLAAAKTKELLNEADFSNVVPTSVTENTTKHLAEKIKRSSQTEK